MESSDKVTVTIDRELEDLIPGYLENRHKDVANLENALQNGDMEVPKVLGHRMKGSGAGYGFDQITEIGRSIEAAAKALDAEGVRQQVLALQDYLKRVEVTYN